MRCKNHYTDLSSIVGVCASCLRERLFYLVATQYQSQSQTLDERNNNLDHHHHPVFPRSVSPYITRRKSDTASSTSNQRFFSTPQVGPTVSGYNNNIDNIDVINNNKSKKKKHSFIRFNLLTKLFRSRKQKESVTDSDPDPDPRVSVSVSVSGGSYGGGESYQYQTSTSAMSSPFRLSNIRSSSRNRSRNGNRNSNSNRNKQPLGYSECSTRAVNVNRNQYCSDRGMSPVRLSNCVEDELFDGSSGYETCESRKLTPAHPAVKRGSGYTKNVSGLTFCLSPLVRTSPCRNWSLPVDGGETRAPVKPHLSNTKSFCANRSRKLADFGRFNSNR